MTCHSTRRIAAILAAAAFLWAGGWAGLPASARAASGPAAADAASALVAAPPAGRVDETPRMAILSAFAPELALLRARLRDPRAYTVQGVEFTAGVLEGRPVVLALSGISMVNAAMNTQLLFDRFHVTHLIFSGIAGGVNLDLHIGDVSVPERWGQYLEVVMMRETAPGRYRAPASKGAFEFSPYGMMQPRAVRVRPAGGADIQEKFWFEADPRMLAVARGIQSVPLRGCDREDRCLDQRPRLVVGGNGVSGQAFVDNADFRRYAFRTFQANVLDMESAACAQVAWRAGVPFIAFRSLSDLAGGGPGENEMNAFLHIAADNAAQVLLAFLRAWSD
jgi:adenosylhomocysteine nucleosidase